jgi:hypothetical protein
MTRRPAPLVLVVFALLAAPTPEAVAQAPPRPEPRELWRQFPLETGRSPAERESTPEVSVPTTGSMPGEGTDGPDAAVQIVAIVLAMALVLMLTTGVLAYAARGQFEFGPSPRRRLRRLAQSFPEFRAAPPVKAPPHAETERPERKEPNAKRMVRGRLRPRRRAKHAAAASAVAGITSEVDALRAKLDVDAAPKKTESPTQDSVERLRERLNLYFASAKSAGTANDEVESLKAKLDVQPAPAKSESIPHDEREKLREKLGMQPAYAESASHDERRTLKEKLGKQVAAPKGVSTTHKELETLKAKLAKQAAFVNAERETADEVVPKEKLGGDAAAAAKRETTVRAAFETKLVDHDPGPTSERKVDLHVGRPSPKLDVSDASAKDQARGSVDVHASDPTLREPPGDRAAEATPLAPRRVSAATRRSTLAELSYGHGSDLAAIGFVVIVLALLLLNIAVFLDIGVES